MIVEGNFAEFKKYFGTAFFSNLVKYKTRNMEARRTYTCEGINNTAPHRIEGGDQIRFCHPPGKSRLDILYEVLSKYRVGSEEGTNETFRCNITILADDFWQAHLPIIANKTGKFLCRKCEQEYK
jgi:hypothetical protein